MKYKKMGLVSLILVFCLIIGTTCIAKNEKPERYHQHLERPRYTPCTDHGDDVFCTHLPIVTIDTGGEIIPGKLIYDGNGREMGYTKTSDGADKVTAEISTFDKSEGNNHLTDSTVIKSKAIINVRGNSSRKFDKSNYAIKLITEDGQNNPQSMLGMPTHHEWALHGPFLDKTLIRNYMWYNIAGEIMDWAPNVRFCEVFINGEYKGLYVMTETVTAGKDGARLNLSVDKKDNSFSGYLLRIDRGSSVPIRNINSFSSYAYKKFGKMDIVYPGAANLTEQIRRSIELDCSAFEKALYSFDYNNKDYGYKTAVDPKSFAEYFLINELASNYDAGIFSTYIYKDLNNRYKLCVWDFNSACDGYEETVIRPDVFQIHHHPWFVMLIKDKDFVETVLSRFKELRKTYFSNKYLSEYIDKTIDYLGPAVERNFKVWGYTFDENYKMLIPHERDIHSYEEAVRLYKEYLISRADWMEKNIDTLKQYCENSKVKKFNPNAN